MQICSFVLDIIELNIIELDVLLISDPEDTEHIYSCLGVLDVVEEMGGKSFRRTWKILGDD